MLLGEDFLAASAHSEAVFSAKGARSLGSGRCRSDGILRLKGRRTAQRIDFALRRGAAVTHVSGSAIVDRDAFAVGIGDAAAGMAPNVTVRFEFDTASNER
ncbi:YceI family protein [Sphingomonas sp.]|uniref:YceI family protein n=1 Tax=Sphingomonas sp. TaxID=28214 RepID=UPI003FA73EF9